MEKEIQHRRVRLPGIGKVDLDAWDAQPNSGDAADSNPRLITDMPLLPPQIPVTQHFQRSARLAVYLASDAASYVTGSAHFIDGSMHRNSSSPDRTSSLRGQFWGATLLTDLLEFPPFMGTWTRLS